MNIEILLTCLIALRSDLFQCERALGRQKIDMANSAIPRIKKAIKAVENEITRLEKTQ